MYSILLFIHSWTRWVVLIAAVWAIIKSFTGWQGNKPFTKQDNSAGAAFVGSVHLQLLLGLILYFFGTHWFEVLLSDTRGTMKNPVARFWAIEHLFTMIIAAAVAQVGRIKSKKAVGDTKKHKTAFIFFTVAIILILLAIPFVSRPLFRLL